MIDIEKVEEFGEYIKTKISEINKFFFIVDDSDLVKMLGDVKQTDNLLLIGFIPSHNNEGTSADNVTVDNHLVWLILHKYNKNEGYKVMLDNLKTSQKVAKKINQLMLLATEDNGDCPKFHGIVTNSISIDPVTGLAGCDGWEINFKTNTKLF